MTFGVVFGVKGSSFANWIAFSSRSSLVLWSAKHSVMSEGSPAGKEEGMGKRGEHWFMRRKPKIGRAHV